MTLYPDGTRVELIERSRKSNGSSDRGDAERCGAHEHGAMAGLRGAKRFVVSMRLGGAALLGLLAAFALGSCGGGGEAIGTAAGTLSLTGASLPARTAPSAVTETMTLTETAAAVTETVTMTETSAAPADTAPAVTETETETETVTVTETAPAETTSAPAVETVTVTTTEGVTPAAAAAAAAAASEGDDGLTSTEWGWVAFGLLAFAVVVGGIVWWLRKRSAAATQRDETPPPANLSP